LKPKQAFICRTVAARQYLNAVASTTHSPNGRRGFCFQWQEIHAKLHDTNLSEELHFAWRG